MDEMTKAAVIAMRAASPRYAVTTARSGEGFHVADFASYEAMCHCTSRVNAEHIAAALNAMEADQDDGR